jgi:CRISPR-associated protein Cmr3
MQQVEIKALDTLFFRDGKPFTMAEETWANSLFPHFSPSVLLGALRSSYGAENRIDYLTINKATKSLSIKNFGLLCNNKFTFSLPLDLIGYEGSTEKLELIDNLSSSNPFSKLLMSPKQFPKPDELGNYRLTLTDFNNYLSGKTDFHYEHIDKNENTVLNIDEFISIEPKIGIGRERATNTTRKGALYRVGMTRLEGKDKGNILSVYAMIEGLNMNNNNIIRLGGEGKTASYTISTKQLNVIKPKEWENTEGFKLYLSTPAIFDKGIIPKWIDDKKDMTGEIAGIKIKLLTCSVGRNLSFGGFDMESNNPKFMKKAVPSGSVYYFELVNKSNKQHQMDTIINHFNLNSVSEDKVNEGFGVCYVGKI